MALPQYSLCSPAAKKFAADRRWAINSGHDWGYGIQIVSRGVLNSTQASESAFSAASVRVIETRRCQRLGSEGSALVRFGGDPEPCLDMPRRKRRNFVCTGLPVYPARLRPASKVFSHPGCPTCRGRRLGSIPYAHTSELGWQRFYHMVLRGGAFHMPFVLEGGQKGFAYSGKKRGGRSGQIGGGTLRCKTPIFCKTGRVFSCFFTPTGCISRVVEAGAAGNRARGCAQEFTLLSS